MDSNQNNSTFLSNSLQKLKADGFECTENMDLSPIPYRAVAKKTRFELTKFGFSENFFIFSEFGSLDEKSLRKYSEGCFQYALQNRSIKLPRGIFESVWCFPVAIVEGADPQLAQKVKDETPPKHWASAEIPVIYDSKTKELIYFEKTPIWGAAYYAGFRKKIKSLLG